MHYNTTHLHKVEHKRAPKNEAKATWSPCYGRIQDRNKTHLPSKLCWCPCGWELTTILAYFLLSSVCSFLLFFLLHTPGPAVLCSYSWTNLRRSWSKMSANMSIWKTYKELQQLPDGCKFLKRAFDTQVAKTMWNLCSYHLNALR